MLFIHPLCLNQKKRSAEHDVEVHDFVADKLDARNLVVFDAVRSRLSS